MAIEKERRNSSFELLRIVLILMVMLEHVNIWYSVPYYQSEAEHITKSIIQSVCVCAVNGFVLISGWFGIKGNYIRLTMLIFQLLFCTIPFAVVFALLGRINIFSIDGLYQYVFGGNNYWFIFDYIGLFLFAPLLNAGVKELSKRQLGIFLSATYAFILVFDLIFRCDVFGVGGGYSILWFIYLYILARYLNLYGIPWLERYKLVVLVVSIAIQTSLFHLHLLGLRYTNPFILLPAVCLILIFNKLSFHSKAVNFCASACLSAYMLHMQPCLSIHFREIMTEMYYRIGYWKYIANGLGLIILVFAIAIIYNMIQQRIWHKISNLIFQK
ncbi:acyltransferase family protein [Prevotella sp. HUN102]|uniref:acyltransferase family protein n=1 Tax=Prevotella sp. HUN102 TaxID=1392486 RepID=UPI00048A8DFC|nr:acyltransferase family protein [Prevotella sp. HUN102]